MQTIQLWWTSCLENLRDKVKRNHSLSITRGYFWSGRDQIAKKEADGINDRFDHVPTDILIS